MWFYLSYLCRLLSELFCSSLSKVTQLTCVRTGPGSSAYGPLKPLRGQESSIKGLKATGGGLYCGGGSYLYLFRVSAGDLGRIYNSISTDCYLKEISNSQLATSESILIIFQSHIQKRTFTICSAIFTGSSTLLSPRKLYTSATLVGIQQCVLAESKSQALFCWFQDF